MLIPVHGPTLPSSFGQHQRHSPTAPERRVLNAVIGQDIHDHTMGLQSEPAFLILSLSFLICSKQVLN